MHRILVVIFGVFLASTAAAQTQVTDSAGRTIEAPARVERVFAAGPPAAIVLYTLVPDKLLGWPRRPSAEEATWLPEKYRALPETGRLTGRGNTANLERVLSLKPDLIVDIGTIGPTYTSLADRVQTQTGIPYSLFDGRIEGFPETYRRLGKLLGVSERAEILAREIEAILKTVSERIASVPPDKRPRVYYGRGPNGHETALSGSINVAALDYVKATNVAGEALGAGGLATVSQEQILTWNPEVIVTTDAAFFGRVKSDPLWEGVSAIGNGRVHLAPRFPFPWIDFPPSVNMVLGVRWAAKMLYPDLFPEDLSTEARKFYELFYHRAPSDAEMKTLIAPDAG